MSKPPVFFMNSHNVSRRHSSRAVVLVCLACALHSSSLRRASIWASLSQISWELLLAISLCDRPQPSRRATSKVTPRPERLLIYPDNIAGDSRTAVRILCDPLLDARRLFDSLSFVQPWTSTPTLHNTACAPFACATVSSTLTIHFLSRIDLISVRQ